MQVYAKKSSFRTKSRKMVNELALEQEKEKKKRECTRDCEARVKRERRAERERRAVSRRKREQKRKERAVRGCVTGTAGSAQKQKIYFIYLLQGALPSA